MKTIKDIYLWAEKIWFSYPEKLRFVLVGGFNTVFAYIVLNVLNALFLKIGMPYCDPTPKQQEYCTVVIANIALMIQNLITINVSFLTMRYYVFRSHGVWQKEYIKAWTVYAFIFLINAPCMTFLMTVLKQPLWSAQAIYLIFSTIITFLLHKHYSFRVSEKKM